MFSRKRRAFTLLDLLVLVVIAAANTGLLALGLGKVHDAAIRAKCHQDTKQSVPTMRGYYRAG